MNRTLAATVFAATTACSGPSAECQEVLTSISTAAALQTGLDDPNAEELTWGGDRMGINESWLEATMQKLSSVSADTQRRCLAQVDEFQGITVTSLSDIPGNSGLTAMAKRECEFFLSTP